MQHIDFNIIFLDYENFYLLNYPWASAQSLAAKIYSNLLPNLQARVGWFHF